jgi:hypothetical protein
MIEGGTSEYTNALGRKGKGRMKEWEGKERKEELRN